jgi:hypothetical protein
MNKQGNRACALSPLKPGTHPVYSPTQLVLGGVVCPMLMYSRALDACLNHSNLFKVNMNNPNLLLPRRSEFLYVLLARLVKATSETKA